MMNQYLNEFIDFKDQAKNIAKREILMAPFINDVVISSSSFSEAITKLLATSFSSAFIPKANWYEIFISAFDGSYGLYEEEDIVSLLVNDIHAIQERDPACTNLVQAFLYFKGFKSLQAHRAAHILWCHGRKDVAFAIQSRTSELWCVDIHPAAKIGAGFMIDHGTGLVIGETAVVGRNCSFLHGVTLGSTGKDQGDRHPKVGDDVLIGCNAIILGNITIGTSAKIGSGSVVIKSVPDHVTAVGNPARIVGKSSMDKTKSAAKEMDLAFAQVISPDGSHFNSTWASFADGSLAFEDIDVENKKVISREDLRSLFKMKFGVELSSKCLDFLFNMLDATGDGKICENDFKEKFPLLQPLLKYNFVYKYDESKARGSLKCREDCDEKMLISTPVHGMGVQDDPREIGRVPSSSGTSLLRTTSRKSETSSDFCNRSFEHAGDVITFVGVEEKDIDEIVLKYVRQLSEESKTLSMYGGCI